MADRRMFSKEIVESDAFLDMPHSAQALYFHLAMAADDEGFVGSPKRVIRQINVQEDDLKILIAKRFLLPFESGVVVIKHWLMHNTIRMDRFHPSNYFEEKSLLNVKENNAYTLSGKGIPLLATKWQPPGNRLVPQVKLSKANLITRLPSAKRGLTTANRKNQMKTYNENEHQDDLPAVDAESGDLIAEAKAKGKDPVATRISQYFFKKAEEATGKKLVNTGYAHAKKFVKSASESDLKGVIDDFFDRSPSDALAVNFYKCLNGSSINKYLAEK